MPGARMLSTVAMMLIAPMIELMPIMWMAKMVNATLAPPCSISGGYIAHPPAGAPPGRNNVPSSRMKADGRSQDDHLFLLGSAMAGARARRGQIPVPEPPKDGKP